jgi:hypothetical protein
MSPIPSRGTKRSRSEANENNFFVRGKVWYKDGNVFLEAESTQFLVHGSVLSEQSTVLHEMIEDAYLPPAKRGPPVFRVITTDSAQDLEYLLNALYNRP